MGVASECSERVCLVAVEMNDGSGSDLVEAGQPSPSYSHTNDLNLTEAEIHELF